jgi:hypothetical protein
MYSLRSVLCLLTLLASLTRLAAWLCAAGCSSSPRIAAAASSCATCTVSRRGLNAERYAGGVFGCLKHHHSNGGSVLIPALDIGQAGCARPTSSA